MSVEIKQVKNRKDIKRFIYLPAKIHHHHLNWVPPIYIDEWRYFNPKKNKAFSYCDTTLVLAFRNGRVVGRIMGIINHRYNDYSQKKTGRFAYFECWDEQEVAHALLGHIENWARRRGMTKLIGPFGFSDQDPEGFLIEGFECLPTTATYYNFEYMLRLLRNESYTKEIDYVVYKVDILKEIPEFYKTIYQRIISRGEFKLIEFTKRSQLKPHIRPILRLMNECFSDLYGFMPLDEQEMSDLAKRYLPVIDARFVKVVTKNNEIVSFIVGVPNMSEGIQKTKGHILPFGLFTILRAAKKTKQLDLLLGAVKEKYRGRGLDVMLGLKTIESAQKAGFEYIDSHHELETNTKMRAEMERLGGKVYKRFRIFQKKL